MKTNHSLKTFGLAAATGLLGIIASCAAPRTTPETPIREQLMPSPTISTPVIEEPIDLGYDNTSEELTDESVEQMLDSAYQIHATAVYRTVADRDVDYSVNGTLFVGEVQDDRQYFLTCDHVVGFDERMFDPLYGVIELQRASYSITIDDTQHLLEVVERDSIRDVAVLRSETDLGLDRTIDFATEPLRPGDVVYSVGFPLSMGKMMTRGTIIQANEEEDYFLQDGSINPGHSGGIAYVLKDGVPKIAGLLEAYYPSANDIYQSVHIRAGTRLLETALNPPIVPEVPETKEE